MQNDHGDNEPVDAFAEFPLQLSREEIKSMVHAFLYDADLTPADAAYTDLMLFREIVRYKLDQSKCNNEEQDYG